MQLFIFDFDGTLADSFPFFQSHMQQAVEHFGLRKVEVDDLDKLRNLSAREVILHLGLPLWKVPAVARYVRRLLSADAARTVLFPGAAEMLRQLFKSGATLAIVSSNSEANVRLILGPVTASYITVFECGASLFGKAAKFRKVVKTTGIAKRAALTIGDEIRDADAAREAGIAFGAVAWGYTNAEALRALGPAFLFQTLAEILACLDSDLARL